MGNRINPSESSAGSVSTRQILSLYSVNPQPPQQHPALLTSYHPTVSSVSARTHAKSCKRTHSHTRQSLRTEESPLKKKKRSGPRTQTPKPTSRCGAVGRSDKSIWGKLSVRNFRSNCRGQNWLLGRANPAAWGWGTMGGECVDVRPVAGEGQWTD